MRARSLFSLEQSGEGGLTGALGTPFLVRTPSISETETSTICQEYRSTSATTVTFSDSSVLKTQSSDLENNCGDLSLNRSPRKNKTAQGQSRRPSKTEAAQGQSRRPSKTEASQSQSRRPSKMEATQGQSRRPSKTEATQGQSRRPSKMEAAQGQCQRPSKSQVTSGLSPSLSKIQAVQGPGQDPCPGR